MRRAGRIGVGGWVATLVLSSASCGNCGGGVLQGGVGNLNAPALLNLGQVDKGASVEGRATLFNDGGGDLGLNVVLTGNPQFALVSGASLSLAPGGSGDVVISILAGEIGDAGATIAVSGDGQATIPVIAQIVPDPDCDNPGPCATATFVPDGGGCVVTPINDGEACDGGDPCQTATVCNAGECKGVAAKCDDDNVCTVDYCEPGVGCQHIDESGNCGGTNPCQVYYCDPQQGCQTSNASDGTPCSQSEQCVTATACFQGTCTGAPIPDGTPCISPKNPCATDAKCSGGTCDSPSADRLQPGDILWETVSSVWSDGDGGSTWAPDSGGFDTAEGWRAAAAMDDEGNMYLDDVQAPAEPGAVPPGDLVSLDVCGRERWRVPYVSSQQWTNGRHLLTEGIVISVGADQSIAGQSQTTGQTLWTFVPQTQAGLDPTTTSNFTIQDVALSTSGVLYYTASWLTEPPTGGVAYASLVGGILRNGQSKFQTLQPTQLYDAQNGYPNRFGYPLMVDENENLYTSVNLAAGQAALLGFDQTGNATFDVPIARENLNGLAENHGFFVEPVSLTAFNDEGTILWAHTESATLVTANGHSPVIGLNGNITLLRDRLDLGYGVAECYGPDGTQLWQTALRPTEVGESSHLIDASNIIYFATSTADGTNQRVVALHQADGTLAWDMTLPTVAPVYNGVLAFTPYGSLVVSVSERLFGVYAGTAPGTAPWPRFRGENDNDSTPETPASPSP